MPATPSLQSMDMDEYLRDPTRKQAYVTPVFEVVAPSYDRFTRWCTLGMDMAWKRDLLTQVKRRIQPDDGVLDIACGTGDLAFAVAPWVPHGRVIGTDVAQGMIDRAEDKRARRKQHNVEFHIADSMVLPLADGSVDFVTAGYGLRNCNDHCRVLAEVYRVLKPGGILASLECVRPENRLWQKVFLGGLLLAGNFYGWLWHNQPAAYGYLARSIEYFVTGPQLSQAMRRNGLVVLEERSWLFGAAYVHVAQKPFGK